jgi:hypothetical protein
MYYYVLYALFVGYCISVGLDNGGIYPAREMGLESLHCDGSVNIGPCRRASRTKKAEMQDVQFH